MRQKQTALFQQDGAHLELNGCPIEVVQENQTCKVNVRLLEDGVYQLHLFERGSDDCSLHIMRRYEIEQEEKQAENTVNHEGMQKAQS